MGRDPRAGPPEILHDRLQRRAGRLEQVGPELRPRADGAGGIEHRIGRRDDDREDRRRDDQLQESESVALHRGVVPFWGGGVVVVDVDVDRSRMSRVSTYVRS